MSNVQHQQFQVDIHVDGVEVNSFVQAMEVSLLHVLDLAKQIGHTIDWSTLSVRPSDTLEVKTTAGGTHFYQSPLVLTVDSVRVGEK